MRGTSRIGGVVVLLLLACGAAAAADGDAPCGFSPHDRCRAPEGDPCGRHENEAACRADFWYAISR
jgi:hypothetical protein